MAILLVVIAVAVLSMPTPLQQITPDNTWIAFFPYVWLPTILVGGALLLHALTFKKLLAARTE